MYSYLSEKIYQQRQLLFILFLLTNLISLIALPKFQLENNFISFFSDDFEPYKDYLLLSDEYPISDSVVLVLSIDKKQHLVELEGMSQKKLAEEQGISYSTLKSRVQRGRVELKKLFEECCSFSFDKQGRMTDCNQNGASCDKC